MALDYDYYGYTGIIISKIGEKAAKELKLNKETAKEVYFLMDCSTAHFFKKEGTNFYKDNISVEELLSWNEEFVLSKIDECKKNYFNGFTIDSFIKTINTLATILEIYVTNRNVLKSVIDLLDFFVDKIGSFIFFQLSGNGIDDHSIDYLWHKLLCKIDLKSNYTTNNLTNITKFYDAKYEGFIPTLVYQGYFDLLNEFVERVLSKIMTKYDEKTEAMTQLELHNISSSNKEVLDYNMNCIRKYFKEHNVPIEL